MYVECRNCGKKFPQSEDQHGEHEHLDDICFRCALRELTEEDDFDQEPDVIDIENAWNRSRQMSQEELREIWEEQKRYPKTSDDE